MEFEDTNFNRQCSKSLVECKAKFDVAVKFVNKLKAAAESAKRRNLKKQNNWFGFEKRGILDEAPLTDLEQSKMTVRETEQIGNNIISGLRDNRDALLKTRF